MEQRSVLLSGRRGADQDRCLISTHPLRPARSDIRIEPTADAKSGLTKRQVSRPYFFYCPSRPGGCPILCVLRDRIYDCGRKEWVNKRQVSRRTFLLSLTTRWVPHPLRPAR